MVPSMQKNFIKKGKYETTDGGKIVSGCRWYNDFMRRNKEVLQQGKLKIKNDVPGVPRKTFVTCTKVCTKQWWMRV
jgi:hypothetical protein